LFFGLIWADTYNPPPGIIWNIIYDSSDDDKAFGVVIDNNFVYVTDFSGIWPNCDFRAIKYDWTIGIDESSVSGFKIKFERVLSQPFQALHQHRLFAYSAGPGQHQGLWMSQAGW
jgi:hypothetical protein